MEEERTRQLAAARAAADALITDKSGSTGSDAAPNADGAGQAAGERAAASGNDLERLAKALLMPDTDATAAAPSGAAPLAYKDPSEMTEEEQTAYAMQLSLQSCSARNEPEAMHVDGSAPAPVRRLP